MWVTWRVLFHILLCSRFCFIHQRLTWRNMSYVIWCNSLKGDGHTAHTRCISNEVHGTPRTAEQRTAWTMQSEMLGWEGDRTRPLQVSHMVFSSMWFVTVLKHYKFLTKQISEIRISHAEKARAEHCGRSRQCLTKRATVWWECPEWMRG